MDQYDENNEFTPIHIACIENKTEILKLLLQHNPNVNALHKPNKLKRTTMHIAASNGNVTMMKLLIGHGFDCDKFINNTDYQDECRSVFLQLCYSGNVECMDFLMNHDECKDKIDIWQRDIDGWNGLHSAVTNSHLLMVEYLLNNVYTNKEMKQKIFNQTIGTSNKHITRLAAERGTTKAGLDIFKLLRQHKCEIDGNAIKTAASQSSLIVEYMLNEQLYPDLMYLSDNLIDYTLRNASITLIHKNILIIVKYLSMQETVSINVYTEWIVNIFYNIMINGTMDGYFKMFKEMIMILMNNEKSQKPKKAEQQQQQQREENWKYFTKSKIIDRKLWIKLEKKIRDPTNIKDICDDKWCLLLKTMIDSFNDETLLSKYDDNDESDCKTANNEKNEQGNNESFYCNKNHLMIKMNDNYNDANESSSDEKLCIWCDKWYKMSLFSFECSQCKEYICTQCCIDTIALIVILENEGFDQFKARLALFTTKQQKSMITTVELSISSISDVLVLPNIPNTQPANRVLILFLPSSTIQM